MLTGERRTNRVRAAIAELLDQLGTETGFRPGDVNRVLREKNQPMGAWEVRGELSKLEANGELALDPDTALWFRAALQQSA